MRLLPAAPLAIGLLPAAVLTALAMGPAPHTVPAARRNAATSAISFRETVEPFLKANCIGCHSDASRSSGLTMETQAGLFKGGSKLGSKIVIPGRSDQSALIAYLRGQKQPRMPLGSPAVSPAQIAQIAAWIDQGAKVDAVKRVWPYAPPVSRAAPRVKNAAWCRNPVDSFILAKLEAKGLKPSPPADRVALLRRVYADLVGEPPTEHEADVFLSDHAPDAYEKLVDRLLADPRYGERWGRHWLDLVRYADTHGYENDGARPRAWRYRDYVIRSFNADKPYDRFLKEQIAGDELYPDEADAITATGYIRLSPWDELSTDHDQRWQDYLNDVTDTTGSVMLGMTVGCARCHNHKYDRITQLDYYRMESFFVPTRLADVSLPHPEKDAPEFRSRVAEADTHLQTLHQQLQALRAQHRAEALAERQKHAKPGETVEIGDGEIDDYLRNHVREPFDRINDEIERWENQKTPYEAVAEAVSEDPKNVPAAHLLLRGNLLTPGPEVQPGFVASLAGGDRSPAIVPPKDGRTTGRRSVLANWIASADNPLTARVIVNRLWQHHFGVGIVGTPSDFGRNGDPPTHSELLDWLAQRFVKDGWSLKKMHRLMLLSSAYRQSTVTANPAASKIDPTNALLWRMNRIRLEGEALRDSILVVSGRLNPKMGGPGVYPKLSEEVLSTGSTHKWGDSPDDEQLRRTIYVFQRRSLMLPLVEAFDGPDMNNTCPRRSATTIAPQALAMFNGEFSREESQHIAVRVETEAGPDPAKEIARAYRITLFRAPTPAQSSLALEFLRAQTQRRLSDGKQASGARDAAYHNGADDDAMRRARRAALADFCHVLINTNEFLYLD